MVPKHKPGAKIFLGFGIIIALQLSAVFISKNISTLEKTRVQFYKKEIVLTEELADFLNNQGTIRAAALIFVASKLAADQENLKAEIQKERKETEDDFEELMTQ